METQEAQDRIIVALDVDTLEEAHTLVDELQGVVRRFKVGSRLFTSHGPRILKDLEDRGASVFLDLKYHDIPSVVGDACRVAASNDCVELITAHAMGGRAMIESAVEGLRQARPENPPALLAVTALTSLTGHELEECGIQDELPLWVERMGTMALDAGASGLVCSARELGRLRSAFPEALLVTPGIRPSSWLGDDDQSRVVVPAEAIALGSSFLVIGRPIYTAENPRAIAESIIAEIVERV